MFLHIHDRMKIEEVQERFNDCFPALKLEFYTKPHKHPHPSDEVDKLPGNEWIGNVRRQHANGPLEIKSWYTVARVESDLRHFFDLNVQIFRCTAEGDWVPALLNEPLALPVMAEAG